MKWIYSTEAVVGVKVEIDIEAPTKDEALMLAEAILPINQHYGARAGWGGSVTLKAPSKIARPPGLIELRCGKITSVQGASGGERLRKAKA